MTQELRNAIYGVAAAIGALLVVLGKTSQEDVAAILEVVGSILTTITTALAFAYSRPKKFDVVPVDPPKAEIAPPLH